MVAILNESGLVGIALVPTLPGSKAVSSVLTLRRRYVLLMAASISTTDSAAW